MPRFGVQARVQVRVQGAARVQGAGQGLGCRPVAGQVHGAGQGLGCRQMAGQVRVQVRVQGSWHMPGFGVQARVHGICQGSGCRPGFEVQCRLGFRGHLSLYIIIKKNKDYLNLVMNISMMNLH